MNLRKELDALADLSDAQAKESARAGSAGYFAELRRVAASGQRHFYILSAMYPSPRLREYLAAIVKDAGLTVTKCSGDEYLVSWGEDPPATSDTEAKRNHNDCG